MGEETGLRFRYLWKKRLFGVESGLRGRYLVEMVPDWDDFWCLTVCESVIGIESVVFCRNSGI
ncbi:hypothetical protein J2Z26_003912 [Bacillus luteolus]|nr:hypothetical protein [Cytobacillus luteolus]